MRRFLSLASADASIAPRARTDSLPTDLVNWTPAVNAQFYTNI
jgi:hypothetical protein